MTTQKTRAFVVEDNGTDRSSIKSLLAFPEYGEQLEFYFWGERSGENFENSERQVQEFIEKRQERFDVIVLDHCWDGDEEATLRELESLTLRDIRGLEDHRCPSSVRLLRRLMKADVNKLPILVFTWHGYPKWSQYVQQDLGADWTMHKERQRFDDLPRQILGMHKFRQKLSRAQFGQLTGTSSAVALLRQQMMDALRGDIGHIFLSGPAGSGKELVAGILGRALAGTGPYVPFSASAMPETLVESELFGCVKDYPNRGQPALPGAFRSAEGGVLFLDEILSLPIRSQPKLLRLLAQDKPEIQVLGGGTVTVNVRLIVASNHSIAERIATGELSDEYAQRIASCFPVKIPSLSERVEDIPALVRQFCREESQKYFRYGIQFTEEAIATLQLADWSNGNGRALRTCVRKLVGTANEPTIEASHVLKVLNSGSVLPTATSRRVIPIPEVTMDGVNLANIEHETEVALLTPIIEDALRIGRGFKTKAAALLGLTINQLDERIKKCKIDPMSFRV